ncbi:lactosylceramide 4-alpha-galactosyltransferase-like isoform X2 [Anoplolepis gracilipes]
MLIPSRCIFFHKTSCSPPHLNLRQACAIESAARNNRNLNVFVLFFATGQFSKKSQTFVDILQTYDNVYIRRVRLSKYVIDTPLESWFSINVREFSENRDWLYKDFHDYIRMLTLWKFGGVVLNLNSIVLTSLDELTTFAGVQDNRDTDVGVFGVDTSTNFGEKFVNACVEVIKSINADNYTRYNITRVISEVLQKLCYQQHDRECQQFTIYPPEKFYPPYPQNVDEITKLIKNTTIIHFGTTYSQNTKTDAAAIYRMIAKQHCPKIYEYAGKQF